MPIGKNEAGSDPTLGASEPGRMWTRTNLMEATPEVLSPLCWTVWTRGLELGGRRTYAELGLMPASEVHLPTDQNERITGCFYGRQALNIDKFRQIFGSIPGIDADAMMSQGFALDTRDREPIKTDRALIPGMAWRIPLALTRQGGRVSCLLEDSMTWWRREVFSPPTVDDPVALLVEGTSRFENGMREQIFARAMLGGLSGKLLEIGERTGRPDLVLTASGGLGGVKESALMDDLWRVSRDELTLDQFLSSYGYHGPSEGNPIGHSWREQPEAVDQLARQLSTRPDNDRPRLRHERTRAAAQEAADELVAAMPASQRLIARQLLRATATATRRVEVGKSCFLLGIDGVRRAARDLGTQLVALGLVDHADDTFYLTYDELTGPLPPGVRDVVAHRRARRDYYKTVTIPMVFTGMPGPEQEREAVEESPTLTGAAASSGRATGRARVVLDSLDAEFEAGDILVCHTTDPSWSALFTLVDGLVIDVGGHSSHGAILARELGLPCVVGTGDGTRRIHDGALVEVDGSAGTVRILED